MSNQDINLARFSPVHPQETFFPVLLFAVFSIPAYSIRSRGAGTVSEFICQTIDIKPGNVAG